MKKNKSKVLMTDIFKNPRYRGKHVILAAGKIFTAKTGEGAAEILKKLEKKHPRIIPGNCLSPESQIANTTTTPSF